MQVEVSIMEQNKSGTGKNDMLRADQNRAVQAILERLLLEGLESGEALELNKEAWSRLKSRVHKAAAERKRG